MKIKNCPFCGSSASVESNFGKEWWVMCDNIDGLGGVPICGSGDNVLHSSAHSAIERWNRRAPVASTSRTNIPPMGDELGRQWYFDCDGHYIDVQRDADGKYSIFFRDRATNAEAWLDQAGGGS